MYRVLKSCGHDPFVLCEFNPHRIDSCEVICDFSDSTAKSADLVLYHHSQAWKTGGDFIARVDSPIAFKFHNITPPSFFEPYSTDYAHVCRLGHEQTLSFTRLQKRHIWLCDSEYNREIVLSAGGTNQVCSIAPPFNQVDSLLSTANTALTTAETIKFLFVGRFAPNKGHLALLNFCAAYRASFGVNFEMLIVGAIDPALAGYWQRFAAQARALDLTEIVRVYPHLSDNVVHALFRDTHVYVTFSEHEGFCVPILEAQAVGLPIVGSGATAVRETAGEGQFLAPPPVSAEDFSFYAALAHTAACDKQVRESLVINGRRNVLTHFVEGVVENAFLTPLMPWLLPQP